MSSASTPSGSPLPVQPLHNPSHAAKVVVPQAPLGNATNANMAPGMGAKALLAKRLARSVNPTFVSPTDNLMTPCSQKISAAKKKHFTKGVKPMPPLFSQKETESHSSEDESSESEPKTTLVNDDENPF
ncbi:hypothetical protein PHLCEN_2v9369 [Hermanssonia centrifuga]|uniref:Uncharacterized protein n=1 Tax=Hermanssonia centrifuga TaxID=98765 RepID=A0A2R6NQY4_9APHY|nr:hypothetical protein PHLCEN_2v9369 [Hermanssonia centrifuga]